MRQVAQVDHYNYLERLHMQIFDLKKDILTKEEQNEKCLIEFKGENDLLTVQLSELRTKAQELARKLSENEIQLKEKEAKFEEYMRMLNVNTIIVK